MDFAQKATIDEAQFGLNNPNQLRLYNCLIPKLYDSQMDSQGLKDKKDLEQA